MIFFIGNSVIGAGEIRLQTRNNLINDTSLKNLIQPKMVVKIFHHIYSLDAS